MEPHGLTACNSLLSGCTTRSPKNLQLIQNAAARLLTGTRRRDHISPVPASWHWIPVKTCIGELCSCRSRLLKGFDDTLSPSLSLPCSFHTSPTLQPASWLSSHVFIPRDCTAYYHIVFYCALYKWHLSHIHPSHGDWSLLSGSSWGFFFFFFVEGFQRFSLPSSV